MNLKFKIGDQVKFKNSSYVSADDKEKVYTVSEVITNYIKLAELDYYESDHLFYKYKGEDMVKKKKPDSFAIEFSRGDEKQFCCNVIYNAESDTISFHNITTPKDAVMTVLQRFFDDAHAAMIKKIDDKALEDDGDVTYWNTGAYGYGGMYD